MRDCARVQEAVQEVARTRAELAHAQAAQQGSSLRGRATAVTASSAVSSPRGGASVLGGGSGLPGGASSPRAAGSGALLRAAAGAALPRAAGALGSSGSLLLGGAAGAASQEAGGEGAVGADELEAARLRCGTHTDMRERWFDRTVTL